MNEILKFITDTKVFYIATVEESKPKVCPFGFAMEYQDKIYFSTSNKKDVYNQLVSNPYFEVCTMSKDGHWIRLQGKAVFDASMDAKAKAFEVMPGFAKMYKSPENPDFEVFYIEEGKATVSSFTDDPKIITL